MAMIVMSELTAFSAITIVVKTGRKPVPVPGGRSGRGTVGPRNRASPRNSTIGMRMLPKRPSGSRAKILISRRVSFRRDRMAICGLVTNRMPRQLEKHIFQVRHAGAELGDAHPVLRDAVDDVGHEIFAPPSQRVPTVLPLHRLESRHGGEVAGRGGIRR